MVYTSWAIFHTVLEITNCSESLSIDLYLAEDFYETQKCMIRNQNKIVFPHGTEYIIKDTNE